MELNIKYRDISVLMEAYNKKVDVYLNNFGFQIFDYKLYKIYYKSNGSVKSYFYEDFLKLEYTHVHRAIARIIMLEFRNDKNEIIDLKID